MASLHELFEHELRPYSEEQFRLEGPEAPLGPREALALGMVIHELATNAAKYGALSQPTGCLHVTWAVQPDRETVALVIDWSEHRGPVVVLPTREGFGSRLLLLSIERELGGRVELRYEPKGFACSLVVPLAQMNNATSSVNEFAF